MEEILAAVNHDSMHYTTQKNDKDMTDNNDESMEVLTEKNDRYLVDPSTVTKEQNVTALTSESFVSTKNGKFLKLNPLY